MTERDAAELFGESLAEAHCYEISSYDSAKALMRSLRKQDRADQPKRRSTIFMVERRGEDRPDDEQETGPPAIFIGKSRYFVVVLPPRSLQELLCLLVPLGFPAPTVGDIHEFLAQLEAAFETETDSDGQPAIELRSVSYQGAVFDLPELPEKEVVRLADFVITLNVQFYGDVSPDMGVTEYRKWFISKRLLTIGQI